MKTLMVLIVAAAFAVTASVPMAWAATPAKTDTKPTPATKTPAAAPAEKKETPKKAEKKSADQLDINAASAADLKAAGFTDAESKKIIDGRPYKRKDELVKKNIIAKEKYDKIKETIIAHQAKAEAKKEKKK